MTLAAFTWTMLAWWQWAMLLAVPPLIVSLYFLKLRREPLEVPSTYLWHRTIEDLHVNSIWQRLRQSLLLLLQLSLLFLGFWIIGMILVRYNMVRISGHACLITFHAFFQETHFSTNRGILGPIQSLHNM